MKPEQLKTDRIEPTVSMSGRWWRPFDQLGNVSIVYVDLSPCTTREVRALAWLDSLEQAQERRFLYPRPKRHFALCRAALRALLCHRLGCRNEQLSFDRSRYGKPYARVDGVRVPVAFNVSHGGRYGLIALMPAGRVGVDVEECDVRRDLSGIAQRVFTPAEQAEIARVEGCRKVRLFYDLWTMKEALIKALGTGFHLSPSRFEIPLVMLRGGRAGAFRFPHRPATVWRLENLGNADFAAAVAWELPLEKEGGGAAADKTTWEGQE